MSTNSYDSAFEQASNDRVEVRVAIEKLLTRGEMLDKLLECLAPFVSSPKRLTRVIQKRPMCITKGRRNEVSIRAR